MLTDSDRNLIALARKIPPDVTMDALRDLVGRDDGAPDELVLREAIGIAGNMLADLAGRLERLGA